MSPARLPARAISTEQATQSRLRHAAFSCVAPYFPKSETDALLPSPGPDALVERLQFLFQVFPHAAPRMFHDAHGGIGMIVRLPLHAFMRDQDCAHDHIAADDVLQLPV